MSHRTHGHYSGGKASPTYTSWQNMRTRCLNPNDPTYLHYGSVGVTICPEWDSFEQFLADMGERPEGKTLDRYPDNAGNYGPKNCRWATHREQQQNLKSNRNVTYKDATYCVNEWARRLNHNVQILKGRFRRGWSPEQALSTPSQGPLYVRTRAR